ncbi:MAG: HAMP domain-containing protein [Acetobacteraceae bacterium]
MRSPGRRSRAAARDSSAGLDAALVHRRPLFPESLCKTHAPPSLAHHSLPELAIVQLRRYLGPLETLTAATHQLGASNFDIEVRIRTDDELSDLSDDFNRMARSLREQHREPQHRTPVRSPLHRPRRVQEGE